MVFATQMQGPRLGGSGLQGIQNKIRDNAWTQLNTIHESRKQMLRTLGEDLCLTFGGQKKKSKPEEKSFDDICKEMDGLLEFDL